MRPPPRVSVLMPVRDGERFVTPAVRSILAQSLTDLELIVIDDGSRDNTPAIIAALADADARMRVVRGPAQGLVAALNCGLAQARGEWIARLDADDVALPHRLARQMGDIGKDREIVLLGGWAEQIDASGALLGKRLAPEPEAARLAVVLERKNPMIHSTVLFMASIARRLGGYRPAFEAAEDYDLWLRMAELGKVANVPEIVVQYRVHDRNVSTNNEIRQLFSTRLAQRAARLRRTTGVDPCDRLADPPDWNRAESRSAFYAEDAQIARFLACANTIDAGNSRDRETDLARIPLAQFNHRERKIAQYAIVNLLQQKDASNPPHRLWRTLFRLHPARAAVLALQMLGKRLSPARPA
ncbi:MAG: glycosyltransferase [Proteobacteria bacterium]|nr:glycosyltransferase [Pseudomonadota bacterium]